MYVCCEYFPITVLFNCTSNVQYQKGATVSFFLFFAVASHLFFFLFCLKTVDIYAVAVKLCAQK